MTWININVDKIFIVKLLRIRFYGDIIRESWFVLDRQTDRQTDRQRDRQTVRQWNFKKFFPVINLSLTWIRTHGHLFLCIIQHSFMTQVPSFTTVSPFRRNPCEMCLDKVTLGLAFIWVLRVSILSIIPSMPHIKFMFIYHLRHANFVVESVVK